MTRLRKYSPDQPRDEKGRFGSGGAGLPDQLGPSATRASLHSLRTTEGFSYRPLSGAPKAGYMVGIDSTRTQEFPAGKAVTAADLKAFYQANKDLIAAHPDNYMGGWTDNRNGGGALDVSRNVATHEEAQALMAEHPTEKAYYGIKEQASYGPDGTVYKSDTSQDPLHAAQGPDGRGLRGDGQGHERGEGHRAPGAPAGDAELSKADTHSREYLERVLAEVQREVPSWLWSRIQRRALPASGGFAKANRRRAAAAAAVKDDPSSTDVHVEGTGWSASVTTPPGMSRRRRVAKGEGSHGGAMVALALSPDAVARLSPLALEDDDELHLTLAYLGEVGEMGPETAAALVASVVSWAMGEQPVAASVSGVGRFHADTAELDPDDEDEATDVVYASIDSAELLALRQRLCDTLDAVEVGYATNHGYTPHVTLSYVPAGAQDLSAGERLQPFDTEFDTVMVCVGDERIDIALGGAVLDVEDEDDMAKADEPQLTVQGGEWSSEAQLWKADLVDEPEQQVVYGVALVPDLTDSQGDVISAEEIEAAAHDFMLRYQEHGVQHGDEPLASLRVVESFIAPTDMTIAGKRVVKGSWVLAVKVLDPAVWQAIKDGVLTGFSIQGAAIREPIAA